MAERVRVTGHNEKADADVNATYNAQQVMAFLMGHDGIGFTRELTVNADGSINTNVGTGPSGIPAYDYVVYGYTGNNITTMTYKTGGSGGTTVATQTIAYDGSNNITSITTE